MKCAVPAGQYRRRVSSFWEADGQGGHRQVFRWDAQGDFFEQTADLREPARLERYDRLPRGLLDAGKVGMEGVRRQAVEFFRDVT